MKHRRWFTTFALLGVLSLVAAACAGDEGDDGTAAGDVDCATVEFGCAEVGADDPITIGTLLSISGDTAGLGTDSNHGVELAVDDLDGELDATPGQLLGHDVEIQQEDDLCAAEGGQAGGTALANDPAIVAVIGTTCSSSALGVADKIMSDKGILMVSPSNTGPSLTDPEQHQPFYARTAHNDRIQGAIVAEFVFNELGIDTAATINDESPYAAGLAEAFRNNFEAAGGSITAVEQINSADTDFAALLRSIAEGEPGALYFPDFNPACALLAKQAKEVPGLADAALLGSDGCLATEFFGTAGNAAEGVYASSPDLTVFAEGDFYKNEFLPAYRDQFGTEPTAVFHAHAYDAANLIFDAIEAVAIENDDGSLSIPRQELRDEFFSTSGYQGVTGTITCDENGDCATDVTIGIFQAPAWPVEGGDPDAAAIYSDTKSLADVL
jgi:branched-chain amino acid transport system substrate-binding protein